MSVQAPWIDHIASGRKPIEIRSWIVKPGPLALAASANGGSQLRVLVDVLECRVATRRDAQASMCEPSDLAHGDLYAVVLAPIRFALRRDRVTTARRIRVGNSHRPLVRGEKTTFAGIWYGEVALADGRDPAEAMTIYDCGDCGEFLRLGAEAEQPCPNCGV